MNTETSQENTPIAGPARGVMRRSIDSGKWMMFGTILQKAITAGSFFILARLLVPEDFGVVAIVMIVPNLLDLLTSFAFESAIIQTKRDPSPYLSAIWTFNAAKALLIALMIFVAAPFIADFLNAKQYLLAIKLSGLFILLPGLVNVAQFYFFKELDFRKIFIRDIAGTIAYVGVSLTLALYYRSFWPLFWGNVAQYAITSLITYRLHSFRPRLDFNWRPLLDLVGYSKWIYGQTLIGRIVPSLQNTILAKTLSAGDIGVLTRAQSLSVLPLAPLYNIMQRVTFPAYSKIQDHYEKIKEGLLRSLELTFFVAIPIAAMFIEAGHSLIWTVLGAKWLGMDMPLKILSIDAVFGVFPMLITPILNAVGKPDTQFGLKIVNIIVVIGMLIIMIPLYGVNGAAMAALAGSLSVGSIAIFEMRRVTGIKLRAIASTAIMPLIASIMTIALGRFALHALEPLSSARLLSLLTALGIFYVGTIMVAGRLLKIGPHNTLKLIINDIIPKSWIR